MIGLGVPISSMMPTAAMGGRSLLPKLIAGSVAHVFAWPFMTSPANGWYGWIAVLRDDGIERRGCAGFRTFPALAPVQQVRPTTVIRSCASA